MQGTKALLGLVIAMGVLILAGTATLIGVVVHRLAHPRPAMLAVASPIPGATADHPVLFGEPAGTRIAAMVRQSDTTLSILLTGAGPDRIVVWDLAAGRSVTEVRLAR
jgi:hypothetical protein